jgi:glycosyltransferase involved in cell wall biosynthesis
MPNIANNSNQPLVTIVTPAYNQGEYLAATMRSVLEQDYQALEYIVIDDGSSDESLSVAERVAAEYPGRVTVVTQPNCGQAATLNKGWGMAKGEILSYLSSDDCLLPQAVSRMVATLQKNPSASVVYCDFWLIDASGRRIRASKTENFNSKRLCVDLVCQPGPGAFFNRIVFDKTGGWNSQLRQVPDFEFWLRAEKFGSFIRVPDYLAEYRIHEGSASFSYISLDRANEIVEVAQTYWGENRSEKMAISCIARAHALASKNHAQSGRLFVSLKSLLAAFGQDPKLILHFNTWRQLMSGLLRRFIYKYIK